MNKKIILISCLIMLILVLVLVNRNFKSEKNEKTAYLTSSVINIFDKQVTVQDDMNIIYTFVMENNGLNLGDTINLEYKGSLDKENVFQNVKVLAYEIVKPVDKQVPDTFNDKGIFSKYYQVAYNKLKTMTLDEKIGQILLVRVPTANQIEDLKKYKFGGYLLFERDFTGKTKPEVIEMIKTYQDNSSIPLLIAVDEEGGKVSRISSNKNLVETPFKSPRELYLSGGLALVREDTIEKSKILDELGINLNLAPVVDVSTNQTDYIYERTLGENTTITSQYSKAVIEASKNGKVSYTLKHFPGYGNNADTHLGVSVDTRTLESIKQNDLPPFKAGIDAGAEAVLISHNIVSVIDPNNPASLSPGVHNLLRNDLEFTGLSITDDLSMQAISNNYPKKAVINAILAGNDLLIVTDYEQAVEEIKQGLTNNLISEELLDEMAFRVLAFKYYKGLLTVNQK